MPGSIAGLRRRRWVLNSWFHLQESLEDKSAIHESEFSPEASLVEWQHLEIIEALEAEQRSLGRRVATAMIRRFRWQ